LTLFVLTSINAVSFVENTTNILSQGQSTEISYDDLPEAVKTALKDDKYNDWEINTIYKISDPNYQVYYSIEFFVSDQTQVVNFDEKGNILL
jgi:hypothetical protein